MSKNKLLQTRHEAMMEETGAEPTNLTKTNQIEFIKLFHRNFTEANWKRWAATLDMSVEELKRAFNVS